MRPGSYLVNVARGGLVDLDAVLAHLDSGRLAGAALDVLPEEPPPPDHPILRHPRVLLNPHAAFYSVESEEEARRKAIENAGAGDPRQAPNLSSIGPAYPWRVWRYGISTFFRE